MGVFGGGGGAGGDLACGEEVEEQERLEDDKFARRVWECLLDSTSSRYLKPVWKSVRANH